MCEEAREGNRVEVGLRAEGVLRTSKLMELGSGPRPRARWGWEYPPFPSWDSFVLERSKVRVRSGQAPDADCRVNSQRNVLV